MSRELSVLSIKMVPEAKSVDEVSYGVSCLYEDTSRHLKKTDVEITKMGSPWPALHINTNKDGKEETCGSDFSKSLSLQDTSVRSSTSLLAESVESTGSSSSNQEVRPRRVRKLIRQYSFNHSDEDDLPPALAAVAAESAAEQRAALLLTCNGNSQTSSVEKSPSKANISFTLEPGDLLMDFTEATPMVDLLPTPLEQYSAETSPKTLSSAIQMVHPRQLMNQAQTIHSSHNSKVDSSEVLRRGLEREKMMKRLLMTEL
ncbi:band 4.1-like protein 4B [Leptodactylus fuscus]